MRCNHSNSYLMGLFVTTLIAAVLQSGCAGRGTQPNASLTDQGESPTASPKGTPLVGTFKVQSFTLPNHLRLLVVEDHSSPTLAYQTWFRVGSRDEVPNHTGLAHLFEHMMFKGTLAHPEGQYMKLLESAGSEGLNAFTSHDYTGYVQEVPSTALEQVASLESDRMVNLVVNAESFRAEIGVVQNERLFRDENNPEGTIENALFSLAYKQHPYHWPVVGYQQDLNQMSPENARDFYKAYYNPAHATVIIVGDVTPERALNTVTKFYGNIPPVDMGAHLIAPEPPQKAPLRETLQLNIQVDKVWMAYRVPALSDPTSPALEVLTAVLTGGKSSRLYRSLVDTGIATSVYANNPGSKDNSLFTIAISLQKGKKAAHAEAIVHRELQRLGHELISEKEMERAKNRLSFDFYSELSSNMEKAKFMGYFETTTGSFENGIIYRKQIMAVTPENLQNAIKGYFVPENRTVITAQPKPTKSAGKGKAT